MYEVKGQSETLGNHLFSVGVDVGVFKQIKVAVSTFGMDLYLSYHVTSTVLHAWLHYSISIKTMHFEHCL